MIQKWLQDNLLDYQWIVKDKVFSLAENNYCVVKEKEGLILDETFDLILDDEEGDLIGQYNCKYLVFILGEWVFYSGIEKIQLIPLRYIGKIKDIEKPAPYLGVHGMYELCNGSRIYKEWCKKAKFLGVEILGICEYNTLAGVLQFQLDCASSGIKSVLGMTALVKDDQNYTYTVKLYAKDKEGWNHLLKINKSINVDNEGFVYERDLIQFKGGLFCVIESSQARLNKRTVYVPSLGVDSVFYQLDPVQWKSDDKDLKSLEFIKTIADNWFNCAVICDSYYLDQSDNRIKGMLNKIGKINRESQSEDQYFKVDREIRDSVIALFKDKSRGSEFISNAFLYTTFIGESCNFKIEIGKFYMPEYKLTEVELMLHETKYNLFWDLIDAGLMKKDLCQPVEVYLDRIGVEFEVIEAGQFLDYFLTLTDIVKWAESKDILVGIGRGSVGGSVIAYLLGLTKVDPIKYDLIFERFLNMGRVGRGLPDIDTDFAGNRREEVKRYMEERYGIDNVCSIGTYGTFKTKAAIRDLSRLRNYPLQTVNYFAAMIEESNSSYEDVLKQAVSNNRFKQFVNDSYDVINDLPLILGQPKTSSVHAAGVIITPDVKDNLPCKLYDWIPVKKMDGVLVSEWEGPQIESAGLLKQDILGIRQLDKFSDVFKLIKENGKQVPDMNHIDVTDPNVYNLFCQGYNQDLFHFGSVGLTNYSQQVKPRDIEELIAMIAMYRPGAMEFGAHEDYVKIKFGRKEAEYDYMLEDVTKATYGLYCYQEQIMQACTILGKFNLTEADDIRKAMGKKIPEKIKSFKDKFIKGATLQGCSEKEASAIWDKLEAFAGYGFNKAHAAAYALTGYFCQWLKVHFPIEFWTVSLQYANEDEIPNRINEISRLQNIKILSPDINKSGTVFTSDIEANSIYWSIGKIRNVGDVALNVIITEREKNGKFFSLQEFIDRVDRRKVNKTCVVNLILSGCFDQLEGLKKIQDRRNLLIWFFQLIKQDLPLEYSEKRAQYEWFWFLEQKRVSGSGLFDYETILTNFHQIDDIERYNLTPDKILLEENVSCQAVMVGILTDVIEKKSKKGEFAQLLIEQNNALGEVTLWNDSWEIYKDILLQGKGRLIAINGVIVADKWKRHNIIHSQNTTKVQII